MKFVSYRHDGQDRYGGIADGEIVDLHRASGSRWPTLAAALAADNGADLARAVDRARSEPRLPLESIKFLPPIPSPGKIICIGLNYRSHIRETGRDTPAFPMLFSRYPDSLVGHGEPMLRPKVSSQYDFEGELAVIIGRTAHRVERKHALDHVAGYSCFNDGSVRDYQRQTSQYLAGKTFWRSGAFGPFLVTADEVGDVGALRLATRLNGAVVQEATTSDLLFDVADLIAFISQITPLAAGDVIATGTTGGVGAASTPPLWLKPGDRVEVDISSIGTLSNTIIDEPGERVHTR